MLIFHLVVQLNILELIRLLEQGEREVGKDKSLIFLLLKYIFMLLVMTNYHNHEKINILHPKGNNYRSL